MKMEGRARWYDGKEDKILAAVRAGEETSDWFALSVLAARSL
jgi:hypothetical protein